MLTAFTVLTLLQLTSVAFSVKSVTGRGDLFNGKYDFSNCGQEVCQSGRFRGFGCHQGHCEYVCLGSYCSDGDSGHRTQTATVIDASRKSTKEHRSVSKLPKRFTNCTDKQCYLNGYHGFGCQQGACEYICKNAVCYYNAKLRHTPHHGHGTHEEQMIFPGCRGPHCTQRSYHGFGCLEGICAYVCHADHCKQRRAAPKLRDVERWSEPEFPQHMTFYGCRDTHCSDGKYDGFGCVREKCEVVCRKDKCEAYVGGRKAHHLGHATIGDNAHYFFGCHTANCQEGRRTGYNCNNGICWIVCQDNYCSRRLSLRREVSPTSNILPTRTHIPDAKLVSDTCECRENSCHCRGHDFELIRKYEDSELTYDAMSEVSNFSGCWQETCRANGFTGKSCHRGTCKCICLGKKCACGQPKLRSKPSQFSRHFADCQEDICFHDGYEGYNCVGGVCEFVCKHFFCKANLMGHPMDDKLIEPTEVEKYHPSFQNWDARRVTFPNCRIDTCESNGFEGFFCRLGICEIVCNDFNCQYNESFKY